MLQTKVAVGDHICFSMPLALATGEMGKWSSDNPQVISVDHETGLGLARIPGGPVHVKYHLADHVVSSTIIEVVHISSVCFIQKKNLLIFFQATISSFFSPY